MGTLWAGAGNSLDRALLLAGLLDFAERGVQLARRGDTWWVRVLTGDGWRDYTTTGDPPPGEPDWVGDQLPEHLYHRLLVTVEVASGADTARRTAQYRTAELTHHPLVLRFDEAGFDLGPRGGDLVEHITGACHGSDDETLTLVFAHQSPDGESQLYRRVIYTGRYDDYEQLADPRNVHVVTVAPGRIARWALDKEVELLAEGGDAAADDVVVGYMLGLSHLVESDRALAEVARHFDAAAWCIEPRVIIGSTYYAADGDKPVSRAIDLRRNVVYVDGDDEARRAVGVTRALIDAQLEGRVLAELTGRESMAAIDVFAQFLDSRGASSRERIAMYLDVLGRLLGETAPGATMTFSLDDQHSIVLARAEAAGLRVVSISEPLQVKMDAAAVQWRALAGGTIAEQELAWAAVELESLLGPAAGSPTDYRPRIDFAPSLRRLFFADSRIFSWYAAPGVDEPMLMLEYQFHEASVDGELRFDVVDYYDEVAAKPYRLVSRLRIPKRTIDTSHIISRWYSQSRYDAGELWLFFSRQMYRELTEQGSTVMRYKDRLGRELDPIRLYLCERGTVRVYVNNQPRDVNVLYVAGGYEKDDLPRQAYMDVAPIMDESAAEPIVINRWVVLDDPQFPMTNLDAARFQTAIPGRVVSSGTGVGIGGATVTVHDTQASGTTWGDGRFMLPIITQPFATFRVSATARGYAPYEGEVDFTRVDAFPLSIALDPQPDPDDLLWVTALNADAQLAKVSNPRVRDLVRMAMDDDPQLVALLPTRATPYGPAAAHAWLLLDPHTMHITAATDDGLYSASGDWQRMARRAGGGGLPHQAAGGAISAHAGFIASWYAYSAGKLDAVSRMMAGETFDDLGHAHAMALAAKFLEDMAMLMDNLAANQVGAQRVMFKAGFMAGLAFFDAHPAYRGR